LFDQLYLVLTYGSLMLGVFVVLLLNNKGIRKSRANLFLSILLMALCFSILHIRFAGTVLDHLSVRAHSLGDPSFLLIAPLLWFYVESLTGKSMKPSWKGLVHFLPFFFLVGSWFSIQNLVSDPSKIHFLGHQKLVMILFWLLVVIQFSLYQFFIHRRWSQYQHLIKQEMSNTEDVSLSWVKFFVAVFLVINVFFLFNLFVVIHFDYNAWLAKSTAIVFALSVFALGYKGILQREIFLNISGEVVNNVTQTANTEIPSPKPDQQLIDRLLLYMDEHKPYLEPELTLSSLAKNAGFSRSQLSQIINDGIGENFYDFVNRYRVEQVKKLMTDPQMKNFNMLGLALEAGFKSKSTFNLIFKRFTGLTPSEYRKNLSS
jgi:AraC-like DNA-binding protein